MSRCESEMYSVEMCDVNPGAAQEEMADCRNEVVNQSLSVCECVMTVQVSEDRVCPLNEGIEGVGFKYTLVV